MSNWAEDVFAPVMAHYRNEQLKATWGHMAPGRNRIYRGSVVFGKSEYCSGTSYLIASTLKDRKGDEPGGPWMYEALNDFIDHLAKSLPKGSVHEYLVSFRNYKWAIVSHKVLYNVSE